MTHPPPAVRRRRAVALAAASFLALACSLDGPCEPARVACPDATGTWVLVAPDGSFADRLLILSVSDDSTGTVVERPSLSASGVPGTTLSAVTGTYDCGAVQLQGSLASSGRAVTIRFVMAGDTARGRLASKGAAGADSDTTVFGLRVDSAMLRPAVAVPASGGLADSTPVVLLRLDDVPGSDRDFLTRLQARGLTAEVAVPTHFVDEFARLTWSELRALAAAGFGMAAHSRDHSASTGPGLDFMAQVVGSLQDLKAHGLPTSVFVQPGTWVDSLYFDTPGKLANWRGALLRNVTSVFEAYDSPAEVPTGFVGHIPLGISHTTVSDGQARASLLWAWAQITVRGSFTVFLIHTRTLPTPDDLNWFLDSVAVGVSQGRVRLVASADALRGR